MPDILHIPTVNPAKSSGEVVWADVPVMLPHKLLAAIEKNFPMEFDRMLGHRPLSDFWSQIDLDSPALRGHPMLEQELWPQRAIPLVLHGDGVRWIKKTSLMVVSFK
eukprot:2248423-Alexandrium_andersonii.AAC.1